MRRHAGTLFDKIEDEISFVADYFPNSSGIIAAIYKHEGDFISAANIYSREGRDIEAAKCWARSNCSEAQFRTALSFLDALWSMAFDIVDVNHMKEAWEELSNIPLNCMNEVMSSEVSQFPLHGFGFSPENM